MRSPRSTARRARRFGRSRRGRASRSGSPSRYRVVPRGIAVEIGCATFPTWNLYPGLFASLATGNSVIVKPHPAAILPAAITVKILREILLEAGFDPERRVARRRRAVGADRQRARPAPRRQDRRLHRRSGLRLLAARHAEGQARLHRGGGRQRHRRRLRLRASAACATTSPSRCRSIRARCAQRRRTCSCPKTGSRRTRAARASTRSRRA